MKLERIRELREENGYTQTQLAEYLCINQRTYSNYEKGTSKVTAKIAAKLADYYDTSVDYIANLTDEREPHERSKK